MVLLIMTLRKITISLITLSIMSLNILTLSTVTINTTANIILLSVAIQNKFSMLLCCESFFWVSYCFVFNIFILTDIIIVQFHFVDFEINDIIHKQYYFSFGERIFRYFVLCKVSINLDNSFSISSSMQCCHYVLIVNPMSSYFLVMGLIFLTEEVMPYFFYSVFTLSVTLSGTFYAKCHTVACHSDECLSAECLSAECHSVAYRSVAWFTDVCH